MALSAAALCSSVLVQYVLGAVASDLTLGENPAFLRTAVRTSGQSCSVHAALSFRNVNSAMRYFIPTLKMRILYQVLLRLQETLEKERPRDLAKNLKIM